ncbi:hypothetical protein VB715_18000 [Crocosphaera sp. UHCC 0190]|uniref:hypothetical protein n=1 Tax=Crocosphaera sp. UHCC 0190 TaxID=3110246 RepID=UPI002B21BA53|nr:hypothetical protein [Crocosphaera sp. UHCC 0190]MEA5511670.1 hypothetical protein [Crocosphaera sp. UHCC 0190]
MKLQKLLPNLSKSWLYTTAILAIGLLTYSAMLIIGIPSKLVVFLFATDSTFLFITILVLLYFAYRPSGWLGTLTSFSATLILFASQLSAVWRNAAGLNKTFSVGGLLPMSDAWNYYKEALRLLEGRDLSGAAAFRPLSHGVLATFLAVTQQNLQLTIAILVLIVAIACFLLAREIQQSHGTITATLVLTIIFFFYRTFIGTVMTENVGLALGAVGLGLLWRGTVRETINLCLLGIFLLTLALNARAGVFFILPALLLWGTWTFRGRSRFSTYFLIGGFSVILLGFIINSIVYKVIASHDALGNSNFSYTFYGLIVGGKWHTVFTDYPELRNLSDAEQSQKVYQLAFEVLRHDPLALVRGCFRAWKAFLGNDFVFSFAESVKINFILQVLSIIGIINCYRKRQSPMGSLMIAALIGIMLSIPFVPPWDGGIRVHAATIPIVALFPALGLHWIVTKCQWQPLLKTTHDQASPRILWLFAIALALLTFAGPLITNFLRQPTQLSEISCPEGLEVVYFRNHPGTSIHLIADQAMKRTLVPNVRISDLRNRLAKISPQYVNWGHELSQLKPNTTLIQKIDLKTREGINLVVHSKLLPKERGIVAACVQSKDIPIIFRDDYIGYQKLYFAKSIKLLSSK